MPFKCLVFLFLVSNFPAIMSYSRPGVAAAVRLAAIKDPQVWERIAQQYKPMLVEKKGKDLVAMDDWCEKLSVKLQNDSSCISKAELVKIIEWKFAKGTTEAIHEENQGK